MPATEVRAFQDVDGSIPVQEWLANLRDTKPKAYKKCLARILELAERGNQMRRPHADYLRDGICELRATLNGTQYRLLYFFYGKQAVALSHGVTKESRIPPVDIERAIGRMTLVKASPDKYTADFSV